MLNLPAPCLDGAVGALEDVEGYILFESRVADTPQDECIASLKCTRVFLAYFRLIVSCSLLGYRGGVSVASEVTCVYV